MRYAPSLCLRLVAIRRWARAVLLQWIASGGASPPLGLRLLPDEHFEFRGGELPRGSIGTPRTRREDPEPGLAVG